MQIFFLSGLDGNSCTLGEEESRHCIRVLRMRTGDQIRLTDGKGIFYDGVLLNTDPKATLIGIRDAIPGPATPPWKIHIAMAPPKSAERFEWFLEKATEIGIDEITPLVCKHSERAVIKPLRLNKILIAAMKQSLQSRIPVLNEVMDFHNFINRFFSGQKVIAWCKTGQESLLYKYYTSGSPVVILIGPEGDFSVEEAEQALKKGFVPVSLGSSRLRTETAGLVACHTIHLLNQIKDEFPSQ